MKNNIFIASLLVLFFLSCKSLSIKQQPQYTSQPVNLGSVGLDNGFLLQKEFKQTATPDYIEPIKVIANVVPFSNKTYRAFREAKNLQPAEVEINYIDSIPNKPNYIKLQIADNVSLINALKSERNIAVKEYLVHREDARLLTHISIALNQKDIENISNANALFLVESGLKTYALQLHNKNGKIEMFSFNNGVTFAYETSTCCWQADRGSKLDIVDLVNTGGCPKDSYRSVKRAKSKIETIKF